MLTALGQDRPGIVAHVTKILYERGCNLEDSAMTRLGGEFAVMLVFWAPARYTAAQLESAFAPLSRQLKLATHLKALHRAEIAAHSAGKPHLISVYGADHPGIVYRVSELLARLGINITDVSTHRTSPRARKASKPLYLMLLEVELPARVGISQLERQLGSLAKRLGVDVSLRQADTSIL